jgi:hypothetical protein
MLNTAIAPRGAAAVNVNRLPHALEKYRLNQGNSKMLRR